MNGRRGRNRKKEKKKKEGEIGSEREIKESFRLGGGSLTWKQTDE